MDPTEEIKKLFLAVFHSHMETFRITESSLKQAVGNMGKAYSPNPAWKTCGTCSTTRYDNPSQTCAYLLKHAMTHTGLVLVVLRKALQEVYSLRTRIATKEKLNVCSLGSGPGTDIVALMFALQEEFGIKRCDASLIDQSRHWENVFSSIISELRSQSYSISEIVGSDCFSFQYLEADLLKFTNKTNVYETIRSADIITMIKFVSAAACKDTRDMITNIFLAMKPGALLLFIDNDGGGFYQMLNEKATICSLERKFKEQHYKYEEESFNITYEGITSNYNTTVAAAVWEKTGGSNITNPGYTEIDYPVPVAQPQCAIFNQSIESGNINIRPQSSSHIIDMEENIRLEADNLSTKNDERPSCCVIM